MAKDFIDETGLTTQLAWYIAFVMDGVTSPEDVTPLPNKEVYKMKLF